MKKVVIKEGKILKRSEAEIEGLKILLKASEEERKAGKRVIDYLVNKRDMGELLIQGEMCRMRELDRMMNVFKSPEFRKIIKKAGMK